MSNLSSKQKRKLAFTLYCEAGMKPTEIAEEIGVSERSVRSWRDKENWDQIRAAKTLTKSAVIANLHHAALVIQEGWTDAKGKQRPPTASEIDMISKISASIEKLDKKTGLPTIIQVFIQFNGWLMNVDPAAAQSINRLQSEYIKSRASEL